MRRFIPLLIAGAALIAAACSDSVAPTRSADVLSTHVVAVVVSRNLAAENSGKTFVFDMQPGGGSRRLGAFRLEYPANSVCDPATSSYGPGEWKNSCETITQPLTITAHVWSEDGRTHIDFSPDIRFEPSKVVTLRVGGPKLKGLSASSDLQSAFGMLYSRTVGGDRYLIDDAADDASLVTVFETKNGVATGRASRRVLHFSGYYVRSGFWCDESGLDAACGDEALIF